MSGVHSKIQSGKTKSSNADDLFAFRIRCLNCLGFWILAREPFWCNFDTGTQILFSNWSMILFDTQRSRHSTLDDVDYIYRFFIFISSCLRFFIIINVNIFLNSIIHLRWSHTFFSMIKYRVRIINFEINLYIQTSNSIILSSFYSWHDIQGFRLAVRYNFFQLINTMKKRTEKQSIFPWKTFMIVCGKLMATNSCIIMTS